MLCAPAGFGKTTALVQWLECSGVPHAWLSLEPHDSDPRRLVGRLLAALDRARPARFAPAEQALRGGSDLRATVMPLLIDALGQPPGERLAIVLDDYHLVTDRGCHELMLDLIDGLPAHVSVVLATRTAPPLRLGRRRAAGTVAEVGPDDLRFEAVESAQLLNGPLALELPADDLRLIDEHVHGWAAGLALVASALAARDDRTGLLDAVSRSRASLDSYLTEEVLDTARPELREFLCRTSILPRLSAPLCEAVLENPNARELLEEVRQMNLFVTALEPDGSWLRYHQMFADTLRRELERRESELVGDLHRRASEWFEQNHMPEEAMEHALVAGDGPRAVALLAASWLPLMMDRRYVTVRRILDRLPEQRGDLGPMCEALDVLCLVYEGVDQRITAERAFRLADRHGDDPRLRPLLEAVLISPFYGDVGRAAEIGRAAWERNRDVPEVQMHLVGPVALVLWFVGDHEGVRALLEPRMQLEQPDYVRIWTLAILSITASEEGKADIAEHYGREAMARIREIGGETATEFVGASWVLGEALRQNGKLVEARRYINQGLENEGRRPGSVGQALALTYDAKLALAEGDHRRARRSARRARGIIGGYSDLGRVPAILAGVEAALDAPTDNPLLGSRPTPAELRVLRLLDSDRTFAEIAAELYVSRDTVKSHARRLYRRLGERTREGAVAVARERGLLGETG